MSVLSQDIFVMDIYVIGNAEKKNPKHWHDWEFSRLFDVENNIMSSMIHFRGMRIQYIYIELYDFCCTPWFYNDVQVKVQRIHHVERVARGAFLSVVALLKVCFRFFLCFLKPVICVNIISYVFWIL